MKMTRFLLSTFFALLSAVAQAEIRESVTMRDVGPEIGRSTIVVFDLDNTVMEPVQTLGSDQFFGYLVKKAESRGLPKEEAIQWALRQNTPIQPVSRVRAVERIAPRFIKGLQEKGVPVFALTARPAEWARGTLQQLDSLNVDFSLTAPRRREGPAGPSHAGYFASGVLFQAKGSDKGASLTEFLRQVGWQPAKILFVDDKSSNVEAVEAALEKTSIRHISFRYGAADARVKAFDPRVAEIQWSHFRRTKKFLSDEEAIKRVK